MKAMITPYIGELLAAALLFARQTDIPEAPTTLVGLSWMVSVGLFVAARHFYLGREKDQEKYLDLIHKTLEENNKSLRATNRAIAAISDQLELYQKLDNIQSSLETRDGK